MWRDAALVGAKDLRVELRSRVTTMQVAPYAVLVLLLFGFAFDQNHTLLTQAAPGLFWLAVLLCTLLAVQRSFAVEAADGARDGLRLSGLDPAGIFLGKAAAIAVAAGRPRGAARVSGWSSSSAPTCSDPGLLRGHGGGRHPRAGRRWHRVRDDGGRAARPGDAAAAAGPAGRGARPARRHPGLDGRPGPLDHGRLEVAGPAGRASPPSM